MLTEETRPSNYKHSLSVLVPAFNEESTLPLVIARLLALPAILEVIIIDDCSTDRTLEVAEALAIQSPRVRVIKLARNSGKTAALKAGFAASKGEIVIVQDADLEYDPSEIPDVISPIVLRAKQMWCMVLAF